jgi:hypothetical protein
MRFQQDLVANKLEGVPAKRPEMVQLTDRGGNWPVHGAIITFSKGKPPF